MKKILLSLIIGVLLLSGLGAVAYQDDSAVMEITEELVFSTPQIEDRDQHVSVSIEGANSCIIHPERPILPLYRNTIMFPWGTRIKDVTVIIPTVEKLATLKKIITAPQPVIPSISQQVSAVETDYIQTEEMYPESWLNYWVGSGIYNGENVIFLTYQYYPVRYDFTNDMIHYTPSVDIEILYEEPTNPLSLNDEYDLLILTPSKFTQILQPLVDHKEEHNIATKLVTLEEIYDGEYFPVEGRDDAEKIKYFIKNAFDEWGITYVLFAGGRIPGKEETWHFPVRYVNVFWANEPDYMSDLYFADIYDAGYNFSSWDTNENGIYGEWPELGGLIDEMDLYPEVYLGRLPCRFKFELKIMVNKIINYENSQISKKAMLCGGDNFEQAVYEGEFVCDKTMEYLPDFDAAKVYASETDINPKNIRRALGKGAMFMHLHGHGSPTVWNTHKPDNFGEWEEGLMVTDLPLFFNREYPIVVIGGCHTAMFNVSMTIHPWGGPSIRGLSDWFLMKFLGGSIAGLGYTCFPVATPGESGDLDGDGNNEPDCVESGYGYMQLRLFYGYGEEELEFLGDCWGYTVSNYIEHFKLPYEQWHLHTIHGFVLLGDPSLKIGGYE